MVRVLIRCDASLSIGSGHIMRSRTLARELQRCGAEVIFLCRRQPGHLINLLQPEFTVLALPEQPFSAFDGFADRDLNSALAGYTQEQDADQCLEILAESGIYSASWIVVDHYDLDSRWEELLLAGLARIDAAPKLLAIDDLADRQHQADLLLDQNFFGDATHKRYQYLLPPHCRQLVGPHYALLGPEYAQLHHVVVPRTELRRVVVFFGGVDTFNLTSRALEALMDPELADLAVDVVLGHHNPHRQPLAELAARRPHTTLHCPMASLAGFIARADLAVGAGGATTWERVCLRLPSLVVSIAENQLHFSEALDQAGYIQLIGDGAGVTTEQIRSALFCFKNRPTPGIVLPALTDGWGAPRVAMAMLGPHRAIRLRPAIAADEALLLYLANNDPQVTTNKFLLRSNALEDHHDWFYTYLTDPNRLLLIATTADNCPIGHIRFDRQPVSTDAVSTQANFSLSLDRCACGHGLASDLLKLGLQVMEQRWGPPTEHDPDVFSSNKARNACFARVGSTLDSELHSQGPSLLSACDSQGLAPSRITLLTDRHSWINTSLPGLIAALSHRGHSVRWIHTPAALCPGDVCLLLSCGRLLSPEQLDLHQHNLVVHASALPQGQGWSPMTWQILEGASLIPITLFEAVAHLDSGSIYLQQKIVLQGHELSEEWRLLLAQATLDLCLSWFDRYEELVSSAQPQRGEVSYYRRRRSADSQLDPDRSLAEQFNLLRVVDNASYPAFFYLKNQRYDLLIRRS